MAPVWDIRERWEKEFAAAVERIRMFSRFERGSVSVALHSSTARRRWLGWAFAVLLSGMLLAPVRSWCADTETDALPTDPLAGRQVFLQKGCPMCHSIWGEGGTLGPDLGKVGVWQSVMQLAGVLWNHSPEMIEKMRERRIPHLTISTEEMADLAAFLYFLNYFDRPGDPSKGELLFSGMGCAKCHAIGGAGKQVGPSLDKYKHYSSPLFLAAAMWSHSPAMALKMGESGIARPEFSDGDLAHIFAYIRSASSDTSTEKKDMAPGSPARGRKVFEAKGCIKCHSVGGTGGHVGPDLATADLHRSVTEVAGRLWNHEPNMWATMQALGISLPQFSDQEISDLMAYLFFLQYFDPPGDAVKGHDVFIEKGCILCHYTPRGTEKRLAPDLSRSPALSSPLALSSALWNHAPAMEIKIRERGIPWPRFHDADMRDLVEYLRSLSSTRP
ncbi:MAG: c-type cytochrome [Candidatus Binatia bacterium]